MASLTPTPKQQIYGSDGNPLVGGKIYTYAAGTTTPLATYTDAGAGTANTNPIILNSLGQANIWLGSSSYKFSVYTSTDVLLYTVDNINAPLDAAGLATALSSPTPIGNTTPNTGAFTTLAATTGNITTVNATTVNATTITATGVTTTGTLTFSGGGSITKPFEEAVQPITATAASNQLTLTLNPTTLEFRSATLGSGTVSSINLASAASLVVPTSATLGSTNASLSRLVVIALNNAGTIELAVINVAGGNDLSETGLISTTAISASATSNSTFYSTTARTNVAYRVVGYVESTQATAGTWATAPSTIQGQGGLVVPGSLIKTSATIATTSGTSVDFTNIPSYVKRITVLINGVSLSGTSIPMIQLGSAAGLQTTGYLSGGFQSNITNTTNTSGILVSGSSGASDTINSALVLYSIDRAGKWLGVGSGNLTASGNGEVFSGSTNIAAELTRLRLTTVNGTDTFDAGSVTILWE